VGAWLKQICTTLRTRLYSALLCCSTAALRGCLVPTDLHHLENVADDPAALGKIKLLIPGLRVLPECYDIVSPRSLLLRLESQRGIDTAAPLIPSRQLFHTNVSSPRAPWPIKLHNACRCSQLPREQAPSRGSRRRRRQRASGCIRRVGRSAPAGRRKC